MLIFNNTAPLKYVGLYFIFFILFSSKISIAAPKPPTDLTADGLKFGPNECAATKPEWVFCSSFEEGNKDIWDDYDGNPDSTNQLISSPGPFNLQNNNVMRLIVPTTGRGGADLIKVLPSSYDRLYLRWYMKWENGYDFNVMNHVGAGMHAGDRSFVGRSNYQPDGTDWFSSYIEVNRDTNIFNTYTYYRGMYMDCSDPNGQCWGDLFPCSLDEGTGYCTKPQHRDQVQQAALQADKWYCIELMVDGGDPVASGANANGEIRFWVDNTAIGPWNDLWLRTTPNLKLNTIWLNMFFHGDHPAAGVLYDNVVASTEKIGCR